MYTKYTALSDLFEVENIANKMSTWPLKVKVTYENLLVALSKESYTLSDELKVAAATSVAIVKYLWPEKPKSNAKVCSYLLAKYELKYCPNCKQVKEQELFSRNSSKPSGFNTHCKTCYLETTRNYQRNYQKIRKLLKVDRIPAWADLAKIKEIYLNCPKGYHVDHIIPLQGELVSGLHVENNLQYLTAKDNLEKHNKFLIE